ncbi:type IV pilus modification PilV family protein [Thermovibrio sp.]
MSLRVRGGFGIIEVLISMVIAMFIFLALLSALIFLKAQNMKKSIQYEGLRILHSKLEELSRIDYSYITPVLNKGATSCKDALDNRRNYEVRYVGNLKVYYGIYYNIEEEPTLGVKKVEVDVCWRYPQKFHQIEGTTVVRNR